MAQKRKRSSSTLKHDMSQILVALDHNWFYPFLSVYLIWPAFAVAAGHLPAIDSKPLGVLLFS
eukprot:1804270-Amphidinium_carterae.1